MARATRGRGQDTGSRRHLLPRLHRLLRRHPGHPPPGSVAGAERRLLERCLHRHQRPGLDQGLAEWWNWWLDLPIWPERDLIMQYQNIFTQVQGSGPLRSRHSSFPGGRTMDASERLHFTIGLPAGSATPSSDPSISAFWHGIADCRHALVQHRRLQHAGQVDWSDPGVHPAAVLAGARAAGPANTGCRCRRSTRAAGTSSPASSCWSR
jgi:hypothetical protein